MFRGSDLRRFRLFSLAPIAAFLLFSGCSSTSTSGSTSRPITTSPTNHPANSKAGNTSTTSTAERIPVPPPPPNSSTVAAYLKAGGIPFLNFERATVALGKGAIPSEASCKSVGRNAFPQGATSSSAVVSAIKGIPNVAIQFAANQDFQSKIALLNACTQGSATQETANRASASASLIGHELSQLGITF